MLLIKRCINCSVVRSLKPNKPSLIGEQYYLRFLTLIPPSLHFSMKKCDWGNFLRKYRITSLLLSSSLSQEGKQSKVRASVFVRTQTTHANVRIKFTICGLHNSLVCHKRKKDIEAVNWLARKIKVKIHLPAYTTKTYFKEHLCLKNVQKIAESCVCDKSYI